MISPVRLPVALMLLTLSPPHVTRIQINVQKRNIRPTFIMRYPMEVCLVWLIDTGGFAFLRRTKRLYMVGGPTSWEANLYLIIYASVFHIRPPFSVLIYCRWIPVTWSFLHTHTLWEVCLLVIETFVLSLFCACCWIFMLGSLMRVCTRRASWWGPFHHNHPDLTLTGDLVCCCMSFLIPHFFWT